MSDGKPASQSPPPVSPAAVTSRSSGPGGAALVVLLCALLVDVTIETFWAGSPVRWWVLGVVLGYFAVTAAIWRGLPRLWNRMGWTGRATASVFVGLGLLALTVWLPGGMEHGIRVARLTTSVLLSLIAALSVVLAAWILIRSPRVPRAGKWIVGALSLYGVVAFALGAIAQVPYADLLNGGGFWVRLPRALQGPFIAGLVVLPLAVATQILDHALRTPSAPPRPWGFRQITSLALVLVMAGAGLQVPYVPGSVSGSGSPAGRAALAGCGGDCGHASAAAILAPFDKASADFKRLATFNPDGTKLTGAQARERLDYLFDAMEAARKQVSRETFDPKAIVDRIGTDPRALFAWAQGNTALVPYRGVLRGPVGVLMDRMGNSLDRSLLLAELLRLAGHRVRLTHATLSDGQARQLVATLKTAPPVAAASPGGPSVALDRFVEDYARRFQVDPRAAKDSTSALQQRSVQALAAASARVAQQAKFIEKTLVNLVPRDPRPDPGLLEALGDHWWVQLQQNEGWVDLDLAGPNGEVGRAIAPAAETTESGRLPGDLFHTVTIRIVVEQLTPGGVAWHTALEHTIRPLDVLGKSILLRHVPQSWPDDLDLSKERNPFERVTSLVQDETEWLPELTIGDDTVRESSFRDDGEINASPGRRGGSGSPIGGALGGLFGGLAGGGSESAAQKGVLSAEWVEFDIRTPGRPPRKVKRDVFDLIGPAARVAKDWLSAGGIGSRRLERGLALARETEILVIGWDPSPDYVVDVTASSLAGQRAILSQLMVTTDTSGLQKLAEALARGPRRPNRLLGFALARKALGNASGPVFLDEPNVFALNAGVRSSPGGRSVSFREFDIVHNGVGAFPSRDRSPFLVRLWQGVADTNAEALATSDCCGERPGKDSQPVSVLNAAETLAATIDHGSDWFVATRAADISAGRIDLAPDVRSRLQDELARGSVLLLNRSQIGRTPQNPMSCWRINPHTGETIGLGDRGTGQAMAEKVLIGSKVATAYLCFVEVSNEELPQSVHGARLKYCWVMAGLTAVTIALPAILFHGWAQVAIGGILWLAELGVEHL